MLKKLKKLKLDTRIAAAFGILVFLTAVLLLFMINLSLKSSMKKNPVIHKIAPGSASITIKQPVLVMDDGKTRIYPQEKEVSASALDRLYQTEISERILKYSIIAAAILGILAFILCCYLSRRLMKPLSEMAALTYRLEPDMRLKVPEAGDEASKLACAINNTLDRLQSAFNDLEQFNSYASHELRNSIALLQICLDTGSDSGGSAAVLKAARSHTRRISKTVDDMLALSSKQLKDAGEPVDLALLAAQAADEYSISGRNIILEVPEDGTPLVFGREIWLYRAISNLIDNAIKNSQKDKPVTLRVKNEQTAVIVEVKDEGSGIDQALIDNIWQPYFSCSPHNKRGIGLGLAMVYHVSDICGGMVWVDSIPGRGSSFYISIPVKP